MAYGDYEGGRISAALIKRSQNGAEKTKKLMMNIWKLSINIQTDHMKETQHPPPQESPVPVSPGVGMSRALARSG